MFYDGNTANRLSVQLIQPAPGLIPAAIILIRNRVRCHFTNFFLGQIAKWVLNRVRRKCWKALHLGRKTDCHFFSMKRDCIYIIYLMQRAVMLHKDVSVIILDSHGQLVCPDCGRAVRKNISSLANLPYPSPRLPSDDL